MATNDQVYVSIIRTTPEKCWAAITNPEFSAQYWGGHANRSDWKVGSPWQHEDTHAANAPRIAGKVLESTPPKRLVLSWFAPGKEADHSKVTFEIEPTAAPDVVKLTVSHTGFTADSVMAGHVAGGWPSVLSSLKTYLETGTGIDIMKVMGGGCGSKKDAAA